MNLNIFEWNDENSHHIIKILSQTLMKLIQYLLILSIFIIQFSCKKEITTDPIINGFGKVFEVADQDFNYDVSADFKAVFDVGYSPKENNKSNASIETGARFLNMHAQSGMSKKQLHVALVIHGAAAKDILTDAAYKERYGIKNPNLELINALIDADVQIILCGQTASHRKIKKTEMINGVQLSLSAMTALVQLQNEDYRLIKF